MPEFIVPPIDDAGTEQTAIQSQMEERFATLIPGWEAQDGTPERALLEGVSVEIAENRRIVGEMLQAASRWLASSVFQFNRQEAVSATAESTWTLTDSDGHVIPAGTQITVAGLDGSRVGFEVVNDVTVAAASSSTAAGEVDLIATVPGEDGNGLQADAQLESFLSFVNTITLTTVTAGGQDEWDDQTFLDAFVRFARRFSPRLVLPDHFVLFALDWEDDTYGSPVERAIVFDNYDPVAATYGHTGELTLSAIQADGTSISAGARTALEAALEAEAISGFNVHVVAPTYTTVNVDFTITVYDNFDTAAVLADAEQAVADFLSPATWGAPPFGEQAGWIDEPVVDIGTLEGVIKGTDGVRRATVVEINGGTADITLSGVPGLPTPGTIVGTLA